MKSLSLAALVALGAAIGPAVSTADPVLSIGSATSPVGGTATVDLSISGLSSGTPLGAYDLNVAFDAAIVSFNAANFGGSNLGDQLNLEGIGTLTGVTPGAGTVEVYEISLDSTNALQTLQQSSFPLLQFVFNAISQGVSNLSLSVNGLSDPIGNSIGSSVHDGSITVTGSGSMSAPELDPGSVVGALTLLCGGLVVLRSSRPRADL